MSDRLRPPVFVTGGSGYLGRNLVRALCARGLEVRVLVRSQYAAAIVDRLGAAPVRGDLDDRKALRAGMKGARSVIHAAAYVDLWGAPDVFQRINVDGTDNVLRAAQDEGIERFLHVSTEAVLADGRPIVRADETRPIPAAPLSGYPRSKADAERAVVRANRDGFETVVIRPRLVWGRDETRFLPELVQAVTTGRFAWIAGGRHLTSTCHVVNACHGALLALERGRGGGVYFLTDGPPVVLRDFLTALLRARGAEPGRRSIPLWLARTLATAQEGVFVRFGLEGQPAITRVVVALFGHEVTVADDLARRELGYSPILTREEGFEELRTGGWKELPVDR